MKKITGNHNITPIVALKHQRNTLVTIDAPPSISVIDIIIVSAQGRRVDATELDGGCMNTCYSGMSAMGSSKGTSGRRRREPVC